MSKQSKLPDDIVQRLEKKGLARVLGVRLFSRELRRLHSQRRLKKNEVGVICVLRKAGLRFLHLSRIDWLKTGPDWSKVESPSKATASVLPDCSVWTPIGMP